MAVLGVVYRDLSNLMTHILRVGFYLSPCLYGLDLVQSAAISKFGQDGGDLAVSIYMLNPVAIIISGYRDAVFYGRFMPGHLWIQLIIECVVIIGVGQWIYRYYDRFVIKYL